MISRTSISRTLISRTLISHTLISRTLKWTLGVGATLLSPLALAVGLGELQLGSAMEERFSAEIELLQIGDLNEHQMAISLAPPEDFERAGIERDFRLADLRFKVDLSTPTRPVIKVSSRRPIHEPYLNFLVELRWPSGRLLREYTALLDLPTFAGEPALGKTSAATPPVAADRRQASPPPRPATSSGPGPAATSGAPASDRVQVRSGDTLWAIAQRHQVSGASIHQEMQAIADANPDAFIGGDINLIRRGAWLHIPDAATTRSAEAARLAPTPKKPTAAPPAVESRASGQADVPRAQPDGELQITSAADTAVDAGSTTGAETAGTGTAAGVGTGLASALEERDRLQRENDDLRSRVQNLEAQLNAASRLVELDAPAVAALQEQPTATETGGAAPVQPEPVPAESATNLPVEHAGADAVAQMPAESTQVPTSPDTSSQTPQGVARQDAVAAPPESEPGPLAALTALGDWVIPALGVTAALLLGLVLIAARHRSSGVQQRGLKLPSEMDPPPARQHDSRAPAGFDSADGLFAETSPGDEVDGLLDEAEVCLSLGQEDQAEAVLRDALDRYPQEARLHLKLLETLTVRDDRDAFEAHLPRLAALGDLDAFAAAQALQSQFTVPGQPSASAPRDVHAQPERAGGEPLASLDELPLDEFDLGLELDLDEFTAEAPEELSVAAVDEPFTDLAAVELDLDLEQLAAPTSAIDTAIPEPAFEDLELFEPGQEIATQLELAKAYVDMGDAEGAREILGHIVEAGDTEQQEAARQLLQRLG